MLESKAGAGAQLHFEALRDFKDEAGRHQASCAGCKSQRCIDGRADVHAGRTCCFIGRQIDTLAVRQADQREGGADDVAHGAVLRLVMACVFASCCGQLHKAPKIARYAATQRIF